MLSKLLGNSMHLTHVQDPYTHASNRQEKGTHVHKGTKEKLWKIRHWSEEPTGVVMTECP